MSELGAYFGGLSEGRKQGWEGAEHTFGNPTAMKTPERGGLRATDKAITTYRLPLWYRGVEHTF